MKKIQINSAQHSYQVTFGSTQREFTKILKKRRLKPSRILIVASQSVLKAGYPNKLKQILIENKFTADTAVIPNGESSKNINTLTSLYQKGIQFSLDRKSLVVALGGGVVTDLAGFFSATYMRGIPYISIPTTIVGMVDAAIGGKTGVDLEEGKNLVGAFWHPEHVLIDLAVLKTLPSKEWKTGFAEVIKYGVIKSKSFFDWLELKTKVNADVETWPIKDLEKVISESAGIKAAVVSADEREAPLKGGREILNFGHTTGHALEAAMVYGRLTHGEAVSVGSVVAGQIALGRKMWSDDAQLQMTTLLQAVGLPIHCPELTSSEKKLFWDYLRNDKKAIAGQLRFVLPQKIGHVIVQSGIRRSEVEKALSLVNF